jgi:hypothetical protein
VDKKQAQAKSGLYVFDHDFILVQMTAS